METTTGSPWKPPRVRACTCALVALTSELRRPRSLSRRRGRHRFHGSHHIALAPPASSTIISPEPLKTARERDFPDTWQSLNGLLKSQDWSTSQLWARLGHSWSNRLCVTIFGRWFLCRNPNWPSKEKIVGRQFTTNQTNSENFPESQTLKMEYTNHT